MATTTNPTDQISSSRANLTSTNMLQFPASIGKMYSRFNFVRYSRNNPKIQNTAMTSTADIVLPLPFNLKEQYSMNYSGANLSWVGGAMEVIDKIISQNGTLVGTEESISKQTGSDAVAAVARSALSAGSSVLGSAFDVTTGTIVNPHLVNVFQGVNLRTHHFHWELSPTSSDEASTLLNIIKTFRLRMHPEKKSNSDFILNFPDQVYVTFYGSSFLYPVFKAVVQDIQINYTDGRPNAWFTDGAPVTFSLDITLQEVESLIREDFEQQQSTTTGSTTTGTTNG